MAGAVVPLATAVAPKLIEEAGPLIQKAVPVVEKVAQSGAKRIFSKIFYGGILPGAGFTVAGNLLDTTHPKEAVEMIEKTKLPKRKLKIKKR